MRSRKDTGITDEELYALVNESYRQWTEQVLETPGLHRTLEEFCRIISRATVFVALDAGAMELLETHCYFSKRMDR